MAVVRIEYRQSDLPRRLVKIARRLPDVVDKAVKSVAEDAKGDFEFTTETWQAHPSRRIKKPKFKVVKDTKGWKVVVDDKRFLWLDQGTDPHTIRARRKKVLSFMSAGPGTYRAATTPNQLGSGYAYHDGSIRRVRAVSVEHPGTKPRNFSRLIDRKWSNKGNQRVQEHINAYINQEAPGI